MTEQASPAIYKAINQVMGDLSQHGIEKTKDAPAHVGGYAYRGIDDVLNALSLTLTKRGVVILPEILSSVQTTIPTAKGGTMRHVELDVRYTLVAVADGSTVTARVRAEGTDSGDKATNKAMSAAYKYMAFQVFCIPTIGVDSESDARPYEDNAPRQVEPPRAPAPRGPRKPGLASTAPANENPVAAAAVAVVQDVAAKAAAAPETAPGAHEAELLGLIASAKNGKDLGDASQRCKALRAELSDATVARVKRAFQVRTEELAGGAQ